MCGVQDPGNLDAENEQPTQVPFDYRGAYEEFVAPTTGVRIRIPKSAVPRFRIEEQHGHDTASQAPAPPRPQGLLGMIARCISPTPVYVDSTYNAADLPTRPVTLSERIERAATEQEELPMGQSVTNTMVSATSIKPVPTAIIEANSTDLTPGTVTGWSKWSLSHLLVNVPNFAKAYNLPSDQFEAACSSNPALLSAENAAIAGTLSAALKKDSEHVANFKAELIKMDPTASSSGYKLLHAILSSERCGSGIYRTQRVNDFKYKDFFANANTVEQVIKMAHQAHNEYMLLPEDERATPNAAIKMLLDKAPISINEEVAQYRKKIDKREALDLPLKWSYDELAMLIAVDIAAASITNGTIKAAKTTEKPRICVNCGSKDHIVTDKGPDGKRLCTKKCPNEQCKSGICPGLRGGICVVCADEMPKNEEIKNAIGKPIPEHIYKWLVELRQQKRPTPTASMATMTANDSSIGFSMF